jgi:hypothetical protein
MRRVMKKIMRGLENEERHQQDHHGGRGSGGHSGAASASTGFAVQDNAGVLVTSQHVSVGETVAYHGKDATITYVRQDGRSYIFRIAPGIPDPSETLTFSLVG